jgi:hypothetical protein
MPLRLHALLQQIETRGGHSCFSLLAAAQSLDLPASIVLKALWSRVEPKACFAAEFLLLRSDWAPRLDAMQDRWLHALLQPNV